MEQIKGVSNLKKVISTSALVLVSFVLTVSSASASINIGSNGANSVNKIYSKTKVSNTTVLTNSSNIYNGVVAATSTGGNKANKNTGGNVTVDSGNANTDVRVTNNVGLISAELNGSCNCSCMNPASMAITDNGARSRNRIKSSVKCTNAVMATNNASVANEVAVATETGGNSANSNTGEGSDVEVSTGTATTDVVISNNVGSITLGEGM